jgi:hypothetical protein
MITFSFNKKRMSNFQKYNPTDLINSFYSREWIKTKAVMIVLGQPNNFFEKVRIMKEANYLVKQFQFKNIPVYVCEPSFANDLFLHITKFLSLSYNIKGIFFLGHGKNEEHPKYFISSGLFTEFTHITNEGGDWYTSPKLFFSFQDFEQCIYKSNNTSQTIHIYSESCYSHQWIIDCREWSNIVGRNLPNLKINVTASSDESKPNTPWDQSSIDLPKWVEIFYNL